MLDINNFHLSKWASSPSYWAWGWQMYLDIFIFHWLFLCCYRLPNHYRKNIYTNPPSHLIIWLGQYQPFKTGMNPEERERAEIIVPCEQMVALIQFINWIFSLELKWNTLYKYKVHWFHSIILVEYDQNSNIPNYSTYVVVKLGCQFWWISQVYWYLFSMFT